MTNTTLPTVAEFQKGKLHLAILTAILSGTVTVTTPEGKDHDSVYQHLKKIDDDGAELLGVKTAEFNAAMRACGGVPLTPYGVWASGETFTIHNQFMLYNGVPYKPKSSTILPYGPVTETPDLDYVQPYQDKVLYSFANVENMKGGIAFNGVIVSEYEIDELGTLVDTAGYYHVFSKGGGRYLVTTLTAIRDFLGQSEWVPDGYFDHYMFGGETYCAYLLFDDEVSAYQIGCKRWNEWGDYNNKPHLMAYIAKLGINQTSLMPKFTVKFDGGIFQFSETCLQRYHGFSIKGVYGYNMIKFTGTVFTAFGPDQDYVIKIGGLEDFSDPYAASYALGVLDLYHTTNFEFTGICVSTAKAETGGTYDYSTVYETNYGALVFDWCSLGKIGVNSSATQGTVIRYKACWELEHENIMIRNSGGVDSYKIIFDELWGNGAGIYSNQNFSAFKFEQVMMEAINGKPFLNKSPRMSDIDFGQWSFEFSPTSKTGDDVTYTDIDNSTVQDWEDYSIFENSGTAVECTIDKIKMQKFNRRRVTDGETIFVMSTVFGGMGTWIASKCGPIVMDNSTIRDPIIADIQSTNYRQSLTIESLTANSELTGTIAAIIKTTVGFVRVLNNQISGIADSLSNALSNGRFGSCDWIYAEDMARVGGKLTYDVDSLSKNKQTLESNVYVPSSPGRMGIFRVVSVAHKQLKILIRYKTPLGVTPNLNINFDDDGEAQNFAITDVGTGEWVTVEVNCLNLHPDDGLISINNLNYTDGTLVDCVAYYNDDLRLTTPALSALTTGIPGGTIAWDVSTKTHKVFDADTLTWGSFV
jgi:hypothetical protein